MSEKFALVTGASSGIGLEISWCLAEKGYSLLLVSNEDEKLHEVSLKLREKYGIRSEILCLDLSETSSHTRIFDFCKTNGMEIEVLVNNAGFFFFGEAVDADPVKAQQLLHVHILTMSLLCTLFGREMKNRKHGFILNVSSISAFKDFPGIAYYGSTKVFIKGFTRSLRTELKYHDVHVTCLCPGPTDTSLYKNQILNVAFGLRTGIMMSPRDVAIKGIEGLFRNKAMVIPGVITKLMLFFVILTPQWVIYEIRKRSKWLK